jgi:REP element-mobilizing transposase RayT
MIAGYHLIWTAYGWWLPNDPRGSTSHCIRRAAIAGLGELHYGRKKIQPAGPIVRDFRDAARSILKHPLLTFSEKEIQAIGNSFAGVIRDEKYTCYGCAIMPDHIHLLIRKHRDQAHTMIEHFQASSREAVLELAGRARDHPVWGGPGWKVYLDRLDDMQRTVAYIRENPRKAGRPAQPWPFVKPYDGWLPGQVRVVKPAKPQAQRPPAW